MMPHLDELCGVILNLVAYDPNFYDSGDGQAGSVRDLCHSVGFPKQGCLRSSGIFRDLIGIVPERFWIL